MGWEGGVCCAWHDLLWLYLMFLQLNTPLIPSSKQYAYIGGMKWDCDKQNNPHKRLKAQYWGPFTGIEKKMLLSMLRSFKKKNWENMDLKCSIKECNNTTDCTQIVFTLLEKCCRTSWHTALIYWVRRWWRIFSAPFLWQYYYTQVLQILFSFCSCKQPLFQKWTQRS